MLGCDASWVTSLVDDLEDPGFVERQGSTTDRRVKLVRLTDKGLAARSVALDILHTPPPALERLSGREAGSS